MIAADLMIGDKVMVKVLSQIPDTYVLHTWTAYDYSRSLQVKPVPLTARILEKNGWRCDVDGVWHHEEVDFCIEKWNRKFQCYEISQIELDSVCQLQQTLRLCGLNGLADNFKL